MTGVNDSLSMSMEGYGNLRIREGVVYRYYNDLGPHAGNCTWGVGTLAHFGTCTEAELKTVVTTKDINAALSRHVHLVERYIRKRVSHTKLTQAQFDALVSFSYNVGNPASVMESADKGDMESVRKKMLQYIYIYKHDARGHKVGRPKILAPLYHRRLEESAPFK
ncbi:MAG: glycoside hydrolase family protein [Pantoea sp.]|uniref:lysozyme n=1 Tax=Pantoea sp. TaxID=69393 RepID=UPI0039E53542